MTIATKLLPLLSIGSLFFSGKTHAEEIVPAIGDEICIRGYIMDSYCINLGRCDMFNVRRWDIFSFFQSMLITLNPINARAHPMSIYSGFLFDNKSIRTLSADGPVKHSVHCLLDVEQCVTSAYEVLNHIDNGDFGRSWQVSSNDKIIEYGKEFGGCGDCKQASGTEGFISTGMQATLTATLTALGDTNTPATIDVISVNDIDAFDIVCNATRVFVPPNGMVTTAGNLERTILIHGGLMLIGWGFLLPSGVILAAFGKHRPDAWWFKIHRVVQTVGLLIAIISWIIALINFSALQGKGDGTLNYPHAVLGMITMSIGLFQPVNAIFRPHPAKEGEEKSVIRLIWEIFHKGLGYIGIVLAIVTIGIGTTLLANKIHQRAFQVCYGGVVGTLLVLLATFLMFEKGKYNELSQTKEQEIADP
jgi:hypothetical protein